MNKLLCGVGFNDSETKVNKVEKIDGEWKRTWICPFYRAWKDMICRCYSPKIHARNPSYAECSVIDEWLTFSVFREWMKKQDFMGKDLDKDILLPGNKIYCPEYCVFVSNALNKFILDKSRGRGEWPNGVCWAKHAGKFSSGCSNPDSSKREHLGYFNTPEEAHEAWRRKKHEHALRYADMQTDERIAKALRSRYL